jgi:DNA-binding XRE family transcriptional regulator
MPSEEEIVADELRDRVFHAGWDRDRFAREVANRVIGYRAGHRLSQTALARLPGIEQPQVARLEAGEVTPSIDTLSATCCTAGAGVPQ